MFFFLPWNIYRNSAYSFFYPGIFLQTVHVHLYPGTLLQTVQVLFLNFLPWNISTNSACSFFFFFFFFFPFFLPWNISTNSACSLFFFYCGTFLQTACSFFPWDTSTNSPCFITSFGFFIALSVLVILSYVFCFYLQQILGARVEACWFTVQHQIRYWQHHFCEAWWISSPCSSQQVKGEDVYVLIIYI